MDKHNLKLSVLSESTVVYLSYLTFRGNGKLPVAMLLIVGLPSVV